MADDFITFLGEQLKELRVELSLVRNDLIRLSLEQGRSEVDLNQIKGHIERLDATLARIQSQFSPPKEDGGIPWKLIAPLGVAVGTVMAGLIQVIQDLLSRMGSH